MKTLTTKQLAENNRQVDIASTEFVTVKELANILHVSDQTVRNIVKELFDPSKLLWRVVNGGNTLYLTTEQATAVKLKLRERNNLKDNSIVSQIGNDLEFFALLKKREEEQKILDAYRDRRIAELQAENELQKQQLTEQAPKVEMYNKLVDRSFCKCLRDTAQFIGEHEKHFLQVLQDKKIIYKHAGHYRAYADYADCFELKAVSYGENKTTQQLVVNIHGLELIKKIFKNMRRFNASNKEV